MNIRLLHVVAGWLHHLITELTQSQSHVTTDGQSASQSSCQAPSAAQDKIFTTVRQLRFCRCGAPSLTMGWVCHLPRSYSVVHHLFTVLHVTLVYMYAQYIQGLCQSRPSTAYHALNHVAHVTTS
jgi:hypothetical protein